ncbi:MAG: PRC-barrel domain containing protein [Acetobacteraceae bacterium]|nr:PRC-barrel domain containing protein [Acetobacteraceae bacterium]
MSTAKDAAPRDRPLAAAVGTVHRHRGLRPVAVRCTLLASALALAPSVTPAAEEATEATPTAVRELLPDGTVVRVLGRDVKGPSGQVVAQVVNVLVDGSGRPLAAILDYGGFMGVGKRRVAVAWRALGFTPGGTPGGSGITLALTRDQLKGFPDHKDGEPIVVAGPPPAPSGAPDLAPTDEPAPAAIPK